MLPIVSTYSNVEALALKAAYAAATANQARERLSDYLVARHLKQQTMAPREIEFENQTQRSEGTALFQVTGPDRRQIRPVRRTPPSPG